MREDDDPTPGSEMQPAPRREPIFDAPLVVVALVVVLLAAYGATTLLSDASGEALIESFAFVPGHLTLSLCPQAFQQLQLHAHDSSLALAQAQAARAFLQERDLAKLLGPDSSGCEFSALEFLRAYSRSFWTPLTYAFLHGGWSHVGLNSIWILAFGPPVARRIGAARFLGLFAATAIAGAFAHWAFNLLDFGPVVGASAADSGLTAAAARFIFEPGGPLGGPGGYSRSAPRTDANIPAPPLSRLLRERRVLMFLGVWLIANFVFGAGAQTFGLSEAPVAWLAHIGGFAFGLLAFPLFDRPAARLTGLQV